MKSAVAFTYAYSGHKTDILSWNFRYDTDPAIIRQFWNKENKLTILVSDYMHIIHSTYILSSFKKNSLDTGTYQCSEYEKGGGGYYITSIPWYAFFMPLFILLLKVPSSSSNYF